MKLEYKGVNERGRTEWVEKDLTSSVYPEGKPLEEWQLLQYRPFVEGIQLKIGRELTKQELGTIFWLSGYEKDTIGHIMGLITAAFEHGKADKNGERR